MGPARFSPSGSWKENWGQLGPLLWRLAGSRGPRRRVAQQQQQQREIGEKGEGEGGALLSHGDKVITGCLGCAQHLGYGRENQDKTAAL